MTPPGRERSTYILEVSDCSRIGREAIVRQNQNADVRQPLKHRVRDRSDFVEPKGQISGLTEHAESNAGGYLRSRWCKTGFDVHLLWRGSVATSSVRTWGTQTKKR